MKRLYEAGYGFEIKTATVSIMGDPQMTFWGIAFPLWWLGPSWDTSSILFHGDFVTKQKPIIAQEDTIEKLINSLLMLAENRFKNPYKLHNGEDARSVWPNIYKKI